MDSAMNKTSNSLNIILQNLIQDETKLAREMDELRQKMDNDVNEIKSLMNELCSGQDPTPASREFYVKYGQKWIKDSIMNINPFLRPMRYGFDRIHEDVIKYVSPSGHIFTNYRSIYDYIIEKKINLSIEFFTFDPQIAIYDEYTSKNVIIKDISYGVENIPIPCVNDINYDVPDLMEYTKARRWMESIGFEANLNLSCCQCTDGCVDKTKCPCQKNGGYEFKKLLSPVLNGIFECNSKCNCNNMCLNKVVQRGLRVKLEIFNTGAKGWGVRCVNDIPAGMFICTYVGLIMDQETADIHGYKHGDEYFADMDLIQRNQVSSTSNFYDEDVFVIDGRNVGNVGRFFNHSCDPNLFVQNVFVDSHDLRFPLIAFFAKVNIKAGNELTWDYDYTLGSVPGKVFLCNCLSSNCRKRLY